MKFSTKKKSPVSLQETVASVFKSDDIIEVNAAQDCSTSLNLSADDHKTMGCELAERGEEGDMRKALNHFDEGILLQPTNHFLWDLKSQLLLYFDKCLPAIEAAEEVVRLSPSWAEGWVTLARAQREFGEIELAFDSMRRASTLHPGHAEYLSEQAEMESVVMNLQRARAKHEEERAVHQGQCSDSGAHPAPCFSRLTVLTPSSSPPHSA